MAPSIRLLVSEICNRFCEKCCNQSELHDLDNLPIIDTPSILQAQEVILTGGETMIDPIRIQRITRTLRQINPDLLIYMYTAKCRPPANLIVCMEDLNGITLTLHEPKDVFDFQMFSQWMELKPDWFYSKSLRLNYFPSEGVSLEGVKVDGWTVEAIEWLDDCPVPEHETLMRWAPPTSGEHNYRKRYHEIRISTLGS